MAAKIIFALFVFFSVASSQAQTTATILSKEACASPELRRLLNQLTPPRIEQAKLLFSRHLLELHFLKSKAEGWAIFWTALFTLCFAFITTSAFYFLTKTLSKPPSATSLVAVFFIFSIFLSLGVQQGYVTSKTSIEKVTASVVGINENSASEAAQVTLLNLMAYTQKHFALIEKIKGRYAENKGTLPQGGNRFLFGWDNALLVTYEVKVNEEIVDQIKSVFVATQNARQSQNEFCPTPFPGTSEK